MVSPSWRRLLRTGRLAVGDPRTGVSGGGRRYTVSDVTTGTLFRWCETTGIVARILFQPSKENFNIPSQNNRRSGTRVCVWSHKFFCELYLCATTSRGPQICCYGIGKGRRSFVSFRPSNINAPPCPEAAALQTCPFGSSFDSTPRGGVNKNRIFLTPRPWCVRVRYRCATA